MKRAVKSTAIILYLLAAIVVSSTLAGCSLLSGEPELQTLTEVEGLFHIEVPADWSGAAEQGLVVVTAAEEIPTDTESIDTFWLLVYPSGEATSVPVETYLPQLVEARATERGWQDPTYGDVEPTLVGGRAAVTMTASGLDAAGVAFEGRYFLVRTGGQDFVIAAIAPQGELDQYAEELDSILVDHWFWHQPEQSQDTTASDEP